MEIADDLLDDFYMKGITFGENATYLAEIIQKTMDVHRQKRIDSWKEKGWLMITKSIDF